ncbi:hypothetical protein [Psychromonas sp. Urea-02u-13]|uniref:hypothetical protein n=1 Tax=Psychromonas sp. Urea-02u-13 TaxID=2058326 RepID=UPI000C325833|nr:hypothetical protein [Psychromonas sp. Urea-02u-13]PKG40213.1 hypothetical protein CXF74_03840 [Psychromonas sp. Urea-02u-13]
MNQLLLAVSVFVLLSGCMVQEPQATQEDLWKAKQIHKLSIKNAAGVASLVIMTHVSYELSNKDKVNQYDGVMDEVKATRYPEGKEPCGDLKLTQEVECTYKEATRLDDWSKLYRGKLNTIKADILQAEIELEYKELIEREK